MLDLGLTDFLTGLLDSLWEFFKPWWEWALCFAVQFFLGVILFFVDIVGPFVQSFVAAAGLAPYIATFSAWMHTANSWIPLAEASVYLSLILPYYLTALLWRWTRDLL